MRDKHSCQQCRRAVRHALEGDHVCYRIDLGLVSLSIDRQQPSMMHAALHGINRDQHFIPLSPHPFMVPLQSIFKNAGAEFVSKINLAIQYTITLRHRLHNAHSTAQYNGKVPDLCNAYVIKCTLMYCCDILEYQYLNI
jgi:hypothetical protein